MPSSINKVILVGNLGQEPEIRHSQDGNKIVTFSIATSDQWKDKNSGERKDKTEWHRVVIFSAGLADIAEKYLKKGSRVYVEGQLRTRKWQDNTGADRYTTEVVISNYSGSIVMMDSAGGRDGGSDYSAEPSTSFDAGGISSSVDDEIPF